MAQSLVNLAQQQPRDNPDMKNREARVRRSSFILKATDVQLDQITCAKARLIDNKYETITHIHGNLKYNWSIDINETELNLANIE